MLFLRSSTKSKSLATTRSSANALSRTVVGDAHLSVRAFPWTLASFASLVVLPTACIFLYLVAFASPQYVSEAKLIVRNAVEDQRLAGSDAFSLLAAIGGTPQTAPQDTNIVANYVRSRTVIDDVGGKAEVLSLFAKPSVDILSRLSPDSSTERIWKYWKRKVSAVLDVPSGILTIETRAFTPNDALEIANRVVERSEDLVNQISDRARTDAVKHAKAEFTNAKVQVDARRQTLLAFRNMQEVLDPISSANAYGILLSEMTREKLKVDGDLASLATLSESSPSLSMLRGRRQVLDNQIQQLRAHVASAATGKGVVASQVGIYESLQLDVKFAERLYEVADTALQESLRNAEKQQVYLGIVVKPKLAERPTYPRPFLDSFLVFVWATMLWSIVTLTIAGMMDHR